MAALAQIRNFNEQSFRKFNVLMTYCSFEKQRNQNSHFTANAVETIENTVLQNCIEDSVNRFKTFNNGKNPTDIYSYKIINLLKELCRVDTPYMTMYDDAVKIRTTIRGRKFIIDYDFDEPNSVYITEQHNQNSKITQCKVEDFILSL